jgi:hypothetical protein
MRRLLIVLSTLAVSAALLSACAGDDMEASTTTAPMAEGPSVSFASPADGAKVSNPVAVVFATHDFMLEPAGEIHAHAGHLHVMVDTPCLPVGSVIPKDATHIHFGKGQTEGKIDLNAGEHTLCLQAGDGAHTALDLTQQITITVDDSPSVAISEPAKDATVPSPVVVKLAAYNFTVEPAGEVHDKAGHLHVMVDTPCVEVGQPIPKDDTHIHLGQGQLETSIPLAPGPHTLCVQAGDGAHMALPITREVAFTVA